MPVLDSAITVHSSRNPTLKAVRAMAQHCVVPHHVWAHKEEFRVLSRRVRSRRIGMTLLCEVRPTDTRADGRARAASLPNNVDDNQSLIAGHGLINHKSGPNR